MSISSIGGLGRDPGAANAPDLDDLYSVAEACRLLRCSRASLYRLIALGRVKRVKVLSRTLIVGARAHITHQLSAEG
jgi:excisionase family DNA binding protein